MEPVRQSERSISDPGTKLQRNDSTPNEPRRGKRKVRRTAGAVTQSTSSSEVAQTISLDHCNAQYAAQIYDEPAMIGSNRGSFESSERPTPFPKIEDELSAQEKEQKEGSKPKRLRDGHKRSTSGSVLSRFAFLRTNSDQQDKSDSVDRDGSDTITHAHGRGAMAEAQAQTKRKRKGSLRKTVLGKGRDRKNSDKKSPLSSTPDSATLTKTTTRSPGDAEAPALLTPRASQEPSSSPASPDSPPWSFRTLSRVSIPSIRSSIASIEPASSATSITSPTMPTDASTDDEELVLPPRMSALRKMPSSTSSSFGDSYFPIQDPVRRMFASRTRSPLATQPQSIAGTPPEEEGWDYSETAFWGYVILVVTWIVFVVGMGSCFDIWSWAWDVGETPYAPPELEDDPTLPIVGYYPALLVLTCVMAWVWVVVAWVGMKYFRHADFKGDDG
ncbi:hypothetical protein PV08_02185 [Exophiala spinifera]|uniref:Uncharacterized protein n=1 Tax=Exophiala spinifera TaxID=91928 RepID=A0A0D2BT71_9EURO|nr:uncharacterized protein PV08_02185 [Exophiala spinifera]KIW21605.1 hypothetical protein PV08_02185 [Exophiala spinifera]